MPTRHTQPCKPRLMYLTDESDSRVPAVLPSSREITFDTDRELLDLLDEEIPHHYNVRFGYGEMDRYDRRVAGTPDDVLSYLSDLRQKLEVSFGVSADTRLVKK